MYLAIFVAPDVEGQADNNEQSQTDSEGEEDDGYYNTTRELVGSEAIPVTKLEWYNNTNLETIKEQYKVSNSTVWYLFSMSRRFLILFLAIISRFITLQINKKELELK